MSRKADYIETRKDFMRFLNGQAEGDKDNALFVFCFQEATEVLCDMADSLSGIALELKMLEKEISQLRRSLK